MRRLEADIFPAFGHKFVDAVTAAGVRELMLQSRDAMREMLPNARTKQRHRNNCCGFTHKSECRFTHKAKVARSIFQQLTGTRTP